MDTERPGANQTDPTDPTDTTVLVTGGSGYLGGWCLVELLRRGHRVRATVRDLAREPAVRAAVTTEVEAGDRLSFVAADLSADAGWDAAVHGCDVVLHVASPFPPTLPKDPDELIGPARDGTLRVLRASLRAGVRRVVLTSSIAAAGYPTGPEPDSITEEHWTDVDHPLALPYIQSKTLAERAAWDLVREAAAADRLVAVNPGTILGPVLGSDFSYSVQIIERLLNRDIPGCPRLGFTYVDVRDVVDLQLRVMTAPAAAGERFLAVAEFAWIEDLARILRERLGPAAERVPTRRVPSLLVRASAMFDPGLRQVVGELGRQTMFTAEKARTVLGWSPRPLEDTVVDCAQSLIRHGAIRGAPAST